MNRKPNVHMLITVVFFILPPNLQIAARVDQTSAGERHWEIWLHMGRQEAGQLQRHPGKEP
jgi:hypothetical protein